ncbi:hypothetical protein J7F03_22475 [Streptomyces sp. ISL-43]|uniref:phage baseplate protein n=1 Tax=Streptomyces sp. ISL-43 TaxID=2819183 RepID=UPI001BE686CA|nr:hypothetical protein [Streptomyces sp. ISL-43]MBT2449790.1 hypothetical protein [Streptomyces sp. ISL-43]
MATGAIDTAQVPKALLTGAYTAARRIQMQSFAIDGAAEQIYVLQCIPAGVRLADEPKALPFEERLTAGDLVCTRMDFQGNVLDRMYLRGFGHGTALSVVARAGGGVDLWLDGLARQESYGSEGQAVATTAYVPSTDTAVDCVDTSRVRTWAPSGPQQHYVPAVDTLNRRIAVATRTAAPADRNSYVYKYRLYDFDAAARGKWIPLHTVTRTQAYPQGVATFGDHLYTWTGRGDEDDAWVTTVDWRTGEPVQATLIRREPSDATREPEGIALWTPADGEAAKTRLCLGFGVSHVLPDGTRSDRALTVKYLAGPAEPDLTVHVLVDWTDITLATDVTSGFASRPPRARLISLAGNRLLQLSGMVKCSFADSTSDGIIGTLPAALWPSFDLDVACPRNARTGLAVCRVAVNVNGTLYAEGGTPVNTIDWIQLDNFSTAWA